MHRGSLDRRVTALENQYGDSLKPCLIIVYRQEDGTLSETDQAALDSARPCDYVIEYVMWDGG